MRINKIEKTNFTSFRLSPQAIQHIDFQAENVKLIFKQADEDLSNTKYWDLEFKNNGFKIIGKNNYEGLEFSEKFNVFMYHKDAILSADGKQFYDNEKPELYRVIYDFNIGNVPRSKVDELNKMSRLNKAIELTKIMEDQSSKYNMDIILFD